MRPFPQTLMSNLADIHPITTAGSLCIPIQLVRRHHHSFVILHCVRSVRIRNYSSPYFPEFVLNMDRYGVSSHIQSECGKMRIRIASNTNTFHAVLITRVSTFTDGFQAKTLFRTHPSYDHEDPTHPADHLKGK